jgi:hypothetical protein
MMNDEVRMRKFLQFIIHHSDFIISFILMPKILLMRKRDDLKKTTERKRPARRFLRKKTRPTFLLEAL